jgi:iron complex transport system substrate-binding protein
MRRKSFVPLLAVALAVLGGCGDSEEEQSARAEEDAPQRIVSLSPTATETLFAIGAGEQVVAVDDQSDHPPRAPRTGLSGHEPNVEAIAGYRPDLVVLSEEAPSDAAKGLRRLGVRVLTEPAAETLNEAYVQIRELGAVTGHRAEAVRVAERTRRRVERLVASVPAGRSLSVYHELDPSLYSASSGTFLGRIYARLGLRNVADEAAKQAGAEYPQLSGEAVVSADPDLIVLADGECCGQTPAKVGRRPGWSAISAVRRGGVVAIDDDIASRWGPRVPAFIERVVAAIELARGR